ncbi:MAG: PQQ-binding-like beta-propeller repeat protein [Bdellovibrionaceae bacterium]|nr:PQQ-binding-like beta-propeller repeat protein [Pseudobdellovibrionaceae bacterium]
MIHALLWVSFLLRQVLKSCQNVNEMQPSTKADISSASGKARQLQDFIRDHAIVRRSQREIVGPDGRPLDWLIDMRVVFLNSVGLDLATDLFWEAHAHDDRLQIAGLEIGAIPFIAGIIAKGRQLGKNANGLIIRGSRKKYGLMKRVEGEISDAPVVLVDDLMNSGGSLEKARLALKDEGLSLDTVFTLVSFGRQNAPVDRHLRRARTYLYDLEDLGLKQEFPAPAPVSRYETVFSFRAEESALSSKIFVLPKSTPCLDGERIYFGTDARVFYAVDLRRGEKIWEHRALPDPLGKGVWSSPAVSQGRVFYGAYDGNFHCLDAKTGTVLWTSEECEAIGSSPCVAEDLGLVFIGFEYALNGQKGRLVALNVRNGEKAWDYPVREFLHGSPCYSPRKGLVGIGTNDSTFVMLDARTGKELWWHATRGPVKHAGVFGADDQVVAFGSHDGFCYVLEAETGRLLHRERAGSWIFSTPLIVGDHVIFGSTDKCIYVSNFRTGSLLRKINTDGRIFSSPRLLNGGVFIGNNAGGVFELDAGSFELIGRYQLPDRILSGLTFSPETGLYYAHTGDDRIFAFRKI